MPMIGVSEEELQRDRERLMTFIKENPYYDYKFCIQWPAPEARKIFAAIRRVRNKPRPYERNVWKHVFDKDIVKRKGERIHRRGEKTALQQN